MKLVKIEELLEGDEIIISANSKLKYLKVLSTPILGNRDLWEMKYDESKPYGRSYEVVGKKYKSVRCSLRQDVFDYKSSTNVIRTCKQYIFEQDVSKHNKKVNIDLNGRDIYLVKREEIKKEQIF